MLIKVKRYFFNVGQGAFYLEKIGNCSIVYDCGSVNKDIKFVKKDEFSRNSLEIILPDLKEIDKLFISHFHEDHINKINTLLEKIKVKEIYFPVLDSKEEFYNVFYLLENVLRNPKRSIEIFETYEKLKKKLKEKEIKLIKVLPYSKENIEKLDSNSEDDEVIYSGQPIYSREKGVEGWELIPANLVDIKQYKEIKDQLISCFESIENLKEKIKTREILDYSEIREIYKNSIKNLNNSSMVLYSGINKNLLSFCYCIEDVTYSNCLNTYNDFFCDFSDKNCERISGVGCLYTGDLNLKKYINEVKKIYEKVWNEIGIIQIPHHGSKHNFSAKLIENKQCITVISCGKKNRYNHPSKKVVEELKEKTSLNIVTEYKKLIIKMFLFF